MQTPLSWTVWADAVEHAPREAAYRIGAFERALRAVPKDPDLRFVRAFHGRPAIQMEYAAMLGDRLPATTGHEAVLSVLGRAPDTIVYRPTRRRYAVVAWRLPMTLLRAGRDIRRFAAAQDLWYHRAFDRIASADLARCRDIFAEAMVRHDQALVVQTVGIFGMIQPLHDALQRLLAGIGSDDYSILGGPPGGAEMAVVEDIWAASRGRLDVAEIARRHGFHGPAEGELSSRVWREDDAPLRALVETYRSRSEDHDPRELQAKKQATHRQAELRVVAAVPAHKRSAVRVLLRLVRTRLPLRGVAKRSFLQAFDIARAAARRYGQLIAESGYLDAGDDVFFLTTEELLSARELDSFRDRVSRRRAQHAAHRQVELPEAWQGLPPQGRAVAHLREPDDSGVVQGIGVSGGVRVGRVRVLLEPDFDDVEPDEILVAPTTDPSWSSVMFLSGALVVDIGGALSHAAVVARELGLPCVVNTGNGTRLLQTGDRVRVDGATGTVTRLNDHEGTTGDCTA